MSKTYYINSTSGNDGHTGTSSAAAFKSLSALNNLVLHPGDQVLLARGTSYAEQLTVKYSGTSGTPITFGAYGQGADPVIKNAATGVYSSGTHDVIVHDIAISHTSGYAIFGNNLSDWKVDDVAVSDTGTTKHSGAVSFENSSNLTVENSTISGVTGDGMLINGGKGITIANNHVSTVQGPDGDNVQVDGASNVTVTGNALDMSGTTNSTKGNLVVNSSNVVDIEHNTMVGGKYGASVNSNNVTIASNDIHGQKGYSWSFGVGIGENWDVKNYNIHDNTVHDVAYGVAVTGTSKTLVRDNIDVHNNTFDHIWDAALKVDRGASGEFTDNKIATDSQATQISTWITAEGKFEVSGNTTFNDASTATTTTTTSAVHADAAQIGTTGTQVAGNVLSNDVAPSGGHLSVTEADGKSISGTEEVAGKYGVVSINENGSFVYRIDPKEIAGVDHQVSDTFSFVVNDGHSSNTAQLKVEVAAGNHTAPEAVNDGVAVGADGGASGDALANDRHTYGDKLYLRSVDSTKLGSGPVDLAGHYGTLTIGADGHFNYAVDDAKLGSADGIVHDTFMYKMSDGSLQDSASLGFSIDPHALSGQAASDFHL